MSGEDFMSDRRSVSLNSDEVRRVVRDENRGLNDGIQGLMVATEKMTDAVQDLISESRVNEEKFANINAQLKHNGNEAEECNQAMLHLSTVVIPDIEKQVAMNGFSLKTFWGAVTVLTAPTIGIAIYLFKRLETKDAHLATLMAELHTLIGTL